MREVGLSAPSRGVEAEREAGPRLTLSASRPRLPAAGVQGASGVMARKRVGKVGGEGRARADVAAVP